MKKYNPTEIEPKWQKYWLENKIFRSEIDKAKPKYYVLDMFPFPSGAGLHVGHVENYTATDIIARHMRQKGYNVLHPMGWDSFGLPAERYAVRTGTHPSITTQKNVDTYRAQMQRIGFSYDWEREFATTDEDYYKWTQWIFTVLYNKGLAYEADVQVNFCPALGTVLANEEVDNGVSIEGGHPVERRTLRQWMLKITAYAEQLLDDLELVDWPEGLKRLQINWIGKSHGAEVHFPVKGSKNVISVFTTRPDTLFGATYMVLSPEHPFVQELTTSAQLEEVEEYIANAARKSDMDRTELNREKTGVFTGAYAINPVNGEEIPIWIADYVLMGYGTGAIMAVPAHDQRDFEFAKEYDLPIRVVYEPDFKTHPDLIPEGLDAKQVHDEVMAGNLCWPGEGKSINSDFLNGMNKQQAIDAIISWLERKHSGKRTVSYKLRDWLFSRQRYWGEPFPIIHFEDGTKRCLAVDELPLTLPSLSDFKPALDGKSPLSKADQWLNIVDPVTGKKATRETNTMPNWAGSCWYYLRFCDPRNKNAAWGKDAESYWMPVDIYIGGVEHAVLHLLYARFWHKVLYDCGYVTTKEPFHKLRNQGIITARSFKDKHGRYIEPDQVKEKEGKYFLKDTNEELISQIEKMSKSKLNGVDPDAIIEEFGADALRLYEMFMGPLEKEKVWNTDAVSGCRRFLNRFYELAVSDKLCDEESAEALKLGYRVVDAVTKDIDALAFNTAIAKMMEFMNDFTKLDKYPRSVVKMVTQALMPFAPHLAEEVWEILGCKEKLSNAPYPKVDPKYLEDPTVLYIVQVNGKVRGRYELPKDREEATVLEAAKKDPHIQKFIGGQDIKKVVFVPNKLLNIVVG